MPTVLLECHDDDDDDSACYWKPYTGYNFSTYFGFSIRVVCGDEAHVSICSLSI